MSPSTRLFIGLDVHQDSRAVAYVAHAHGAAGADLGTSGPRQSAIDHLARTLPSQPRRGSLSRKRGPVAPGSPGISPHQATTAAWWRRR
jgi:hypothetical protein